MNDHIQSAADAAATAASVATVSKFGTLSSASVTVGSSLLGEHTIAIIGLASTLLFGAGGLLVTWYYKRESNRREQEIHLLELVRLKALTHSEDAKE